MSQRLRFVLDEDVDHRCRGVLLAAGHECWTIPEAGLGEADDDDVAVYAWDKGAIPVITDDGFARRQRDRDHLGGHIVYLDGADFLVWIYLEDHLPTVVGFLLNPPATVHRIVRVRREGCRIWHPAWLG